MNPWELFGLDVETDTRSIKRRYAQLLKQYRPDEDAEAFQRLREAYEYALAWVDREVREPEPELSVEAAPWHQPLTPALFDSGQPTYAPLTYTPQQSSDEHAWVRSLPDTCESLDDALDQARQAQQEPALQLELLRRCQEPGEQAIETLRWAMDRLNWLSPWQADYLPLASMNGLAERLLNAELWMWWSQIEGGEEDAVLETVALLLAEPWMQPFDRRNQVQQGLLEILEKGDGWSLNFFDGLCQLFGWDEARGQIPCDSERWERLCSHSAGLMLREDLHRWLGEDRPEFAQARAAWLLLKPMKAGERRKLVDGFDDADWQACDALAQRVEQQEAALDHPGASYLQQWREWRPGSGWRQLYPLLWGCMCLVLFLLARTAPIQDLADLIVSVGVVMAIVTALLMVLRLFINGWNRFARWRVLFDVGISLRLLPAGLVRGGSGLLLLRHIAPSVFFAALTFGWTPGAFQSSALALLTLILCVQFLDVASRGGAPASWLILAWRQLAQLGKHLLIWVVILVLVAVLSRMFMGPKAPDLDFSAPRPAERPADSLTVCQRPTDANRQACVDAMQMVQEAMQRAEQAHAQKQVP
ncbi:MAG: J domain-containing protein [Pseudomonas sp.]|uniref:J domain-containing protein n=1 Tax=Pseudomonas sp. TaxID=306 RepID=UPI003D0B7030